MKFPFLGFAIAFVVLYSLTGLFGSAAYAADNAVVVTAIVEHPAPDAVRNGIKDELKVGGYEVGVLQKSHLKSPCNN